MPICRIREKASDVECPSEAWEGDPEGLCFLHSRQANKDQNGRFREAIKEKLDHEDFDFSGIYFPGETNIFKGYTFNQDVDFFRAIFSGRADFKGTTFSGGAYFSRVKFSGDAVFTGTTFSRGTYFLGAAFIGKAFFSQATFSGIANFPEATFSKGVFFYGATFSGEALFILATFSGNVCFKGTTFSQYVFFQHANFLQLADFSRTRIKNQLVLDNINSSLPGEPKGYFRSDFSEIRFSDEGRLRFQDLSLAYANFTDTDLLQCRFNNVDWHRLRGRQAIYDEVLLYEKAKGPKGKKPYTEQYARAEESYRYLKLNYESAGDFKKAGDFHYGEMEMHRKAIPWRRWVSLYSAYWVLSGYGERPLRGFIWLLLLIPAWAGLVWGLGIDQAGSQNPVTYLDTLLFIFDKATLQRPPWPAGITWLGKFLSSLSVLLLPGQAALFILALRNRLGRRR